MTQAITLIPVARADFATGESFTIDQKPDGKYTVSRGTTILLYEVETLAQAWSHIRYAARINHRTEASPGVETTAGYFQ